MRLPVIDRGTIIVELFDRDIEFDIPFHQLLTVTCAKQEPISRLLRSEPLTKIYLYQVIRDQANAKFNDGMFRDALALYSGVISLGVYFVPKSLGEEIES
jgi:hypothetical protein